MVTFELTRVALPAYRMSLTPAMNVITIVDKKRTAPPTIASEPSWVPCPQVCDTEG